MNRFFKATEEVGLITGTSDAAILYAHLLALHKNCFKKEFYQNQNQLLVLIEGQSFTTNSSKGIFVYNAVLYSWIRDPHT